MGLFEDAASGFSTYTQAVVATPFQALSNLSQGKDPSEPYKQLATGVADKLGLGPKKKNPGEEGMTREQLLAKISSDTGLDQITRDELLTQLNGGQDVSSMYADALAGKGIYGNRLKNEQLARTLQDIPGQKQLFLSNQQRVSAGQATLGFGVAQSGPLLTGGAQ